jgi:uncharacterized protein YsxB (DUF464 family)
MLRIEVIKNNNKVKQVKFLGHANYDKYGKDIVCAAASATMLCTANAIISLDKDAIEVIQEDNLQIINILKDDKTINILIDNMLNCFKSLTIDYPNNIKITKEEEK